MLPLKHAVFIPPLILLLVSITAATESDHGLANEQTAHAASPAMMAFFHHESPAVALPVAASAANNETGSLWDLRGEQAEDGEPSGGGGRRRKTLMVVGIVLGFVGVGLAVAAVGVFVVQRRRAAEEEEMRGEMRVLHHLEPL